MLRNLIPASHPRARGYGVGPVLVRCRPDVDTVLINRTGPQVSFLTTPCRKGATKRSSQCKTVPIPIVTGFVLPLSCRLPTEDCPGYSRAGERGQEVFLTHSLPDAAQVC